MWTPNICMDHTLFMRSILVQKSRQHNLQPQLTISPMEQVSSCFGTGFCFQFRFELQLRSWLSNANIPKENFQTFLGDGKIHNIVIFLSKWVDVVARRREQRCLYYFPSCGQISLFEWGKTQPCKHKHMELMDPQWNSWPLKAEFLGGKNGLNPGGLRNIFAIFLLCLHRP